MERFMRNLMREPVVKVGDRFQYRKVGIAEVVEVLDSTHPGTACVRLRFITGPRKYREADPSQSWYWVRESERVD